MLPCMAQDEGAILEVKGRGAEGREAYQGGGKVKFLDTSVGAQLIHYDGDKELALPLTIKYEVLEPAPILLTSRMGTEYWRLFHFEHETMAAMYTNERIDLSKVGERTAAPEGLRAWFDESRGPLPGKGLVGIRGHYYFLVDQPDGQWLDVVNPPPFFDRAEVARKLTFTLANLTKFALALSEVQSTWEPGGPLRVKLTVTDADGDQLPVVNAPLTASAGDWEGKLETEWGLLQVPTGWMRGTLPEGEAPAEIAVEGTVQVVTPDGPKSLEVATTYRRGEGQVTAEQMQVAQKGYELPRNAQGVIRETRALWVSGRDIMTREGTDALVARAKEAGLNVLIPDIFVRDSFVAKSDLQPTAGGVEEGLDPLAYLIEKAHAVGLEVHPWFCVTYRDKHFRARLPGVDMIDENGEVKSLGADVHRPEYRDFIVKLMVGVARDYEVDGIHLDYIRTMGRCYCDKCKAEFQQKFGKPLTEATDEEWVAWQREAIGDIVRRTAEGVRKVRPKAIMSAAVFSNMAGGASQGQDPAEWARQGWLDVVIPMDYAMQSLVVRTNEKQFLKALDDDDQLVTGLSLYMRSGGKALSRRPELVKEQIQLVRSMGIHGYCLFVHSYLNDDITEMLKTDVNPEPAVPYFRE